MTYPAVPLNVRIRIAPSYVDYTADPSTYAWVDVSSRIAHWLPIVDTIGANDDVSEENTELDIWFKNDDGAMTTDNAESPFYPFFDVGCPIEYAIDAGAGYVVQCVTFLGSAKNTWTSNTQYQCLANVTAGGQFRRLGLDPVIASPLLRTTLSRRRKGVWALEDPSGSLQAASALPVQGPLTSGVGAPPEFGVTALVAGVSSMAKFSAGDNLAAVLNTPTNSPGVRLSFLLKTDTIPVANVDLAVMYLVAGSAIGRHVLEVGPSRMRHRTYSAAGAEISGSVDIGFTSHQTVCVYVDWDVVQTSAGTLTWTIRETTWTYGNDGNISAVTAFASNTFAGSIGQINAVSISPNLQIDNMTFGMINLSEQAFPITGGSGAVLAWAGNKATERVAGMCAEFKVPFHVTATNLGSALGPQLTDSLLANMRDIKSTDHGVLTDHLGVVDYRALSELYNLTPAITLTKSVRGQLGELSPTRDDTSKVNIASAQRPGGSTFRTIDEDDILRSAPYEREPITVNVLNDSALPGHAGWALAHGVARGARYDDLSINLRVAAETTPALPAQVLALKLGDRIAVTSLPLQAGKDGLERQVRGRKQTVINRWKWDVDYKLVAIDPYQAYQFDLTRTDANGAELLAAATTTGTTLMASMPETPAAVGGPALGIPLNVAGERVTLNTVANELTIDDGTRVVANGWGSFPATAHLPAQAYSPAGGVVGDYAATGTALTMTITSAPASRAQHLIGLSLKNWDLTAFMSFAVLATGGNLELQLQWRSSLVLLNGYTARIVIEPAATTRLQFYQPGGSTPLADIPLNLTHTAGVSYGMRVLAVGSRHRVKVWQASTSSEPSNWTLDIVDDFRLGLGYPIFRAGRGSGNTNANPVASFDNITLNGMQAFTVVRSVNGVVKAQSINNPVNVWQGRGPGV